MQQKHSHFGMSPADFRTWNTFN